MDLVDVIKVLGIAASPIAELRGAIPFAILELGYPWFSAYLIAVIGKPEALSLFQAYRDQYSIENADNIPSLESLEELRETLIHLAKSDWMGRVRTISTVEDGRLIHRCDNCEKVDHLAWQDVQDYTFRQIGHRGNTRRRGLRTTRWHTQRHL